MRATASLLEHKAPTPTPPLLECAIASLLERRRRRRTSPKGEVRGLAHPRSFFLVCLMRWLTKSTPPPQNSLAHGGRGLSAAILRGELAQVAWREG